MTRLLRRLVLLLASSALLASPAAGESGSNTLWENQSLGPNEYLQSADGRFKLTNQGDGNLVLEVEGYPIWWRDSEPGYVLLMQGDGNLVMHAPGDTGAVLWHTSTHGNEGAYLWLGNEGEVEIWQGDRWVAALAFGDYEREPPANWLGPGGWLYPGQERANGRYRLRNQPNGEVALWEDGSRRLWTTGAGAPGDLHMQHDGNLVLYSGGEARWHTSTWGHPGAYLLVQSSGYAVLLPHPSAGSSEPLWSKGLEDAPPPVSPTLTFDGHGAGERALLRTNHALHVRVSNAAGTEWVDLHTSAGLLLGSKEVNAPETTVIFETALLPPSGDVIASIRAGAAPVLAWGPTIWIAPVSLTVNGNSTTDTYVRLGREIRVTVQNPGADTRDWVGLFPDGGSTAVGRRFLNDSEWDLPERPEEAATVRFEAPSPVGNYEVRFFAGGSDILLASYRLIHVDNPPILTINGQDDQGEVTLALGEQFTVVVTNPPTGDGYRLEVHRSDECCGPPFFGDQAYTGQQEVTFSGLLETYVNHYRVYLAKWGADEAQGPLLRIGMPALTINGTTAGEVLMRAARPFTVQVHRAPDLTNDRVALTRHATGERVAVHAFDIWPDPPNQTLATASFTGPLISGAGNVYDVQLIGPGGGVRPGVSAPWVFVPEYKLWVNGVLQDMTIPTGEAFQVSVAAEGHEPGDWLAVFALDAADNAPVPGVPPAVIDGAPNGVFPGGSPAYVRTFTMPGSGGPFEVRFFDASSLRLGTSHPLTCGGCFTGPRRLTVNGETDLAPDQTVAANQSVSVVATGPTLGTNDRVVFLSTVTGQVVADHGVTPNASATATDTFTMTAPAASGRYAVQWLAPESATPLAHGPGLVVPGPRGTDLETFYYDTDAIGSVRQITNAEGGVVERRDYTPFGAAWPPAAWSAEHPLAFGGKERDATGLDYFGARYHGSLLGRFTTVDPYLDPQTALLGPQQWNRYVYALNNPLKFTDPDGRNPLLVGGIGAAAYAAWNAYVNVQQERPWYENIGVEASKGFLVGATLGLAGPALGAVSVAHSAATAAAGARVAKDAFETAQAGGRHSGMLRNYLGTSASSLRSGIASFEERIATHLDKIKNPSRYIPDFEKLDPRRQRALIDKEWPRQIQQQREQLEILKRLLEQREQP